jgi:hypothetical protein
MTSDAFFESNFVSAINAKIDLAFLDGMHLFEFILRDVMNCEKVMSPSGTIVLHDVIPIGYLATRRQWDRDATNAWTGDVWKVLPALRKYRPDLDITVLDAAPSGMAIIRNLDPSSTTLDRSFDDIVAEFADYDLQPDNIEAITEELEIVNALGFLAALETVQNTNVRVTVHIPPRRMGERFYAESLGAAFQRAGVPAVVLEHDLEPKEATSDAPQEGTADGEIAIVLRGKRPPSHPKASKSILWVQSQADSVTDAEMDDYDHVCWASSSPPKRDTKATQSTLLQCTDTTIFHKARHIV